MAWNRVKIESVRGVGIPTKAKFIVTHTGLVQLKVSSFLKKTFKGAATVKVDEEKYIIGLFPKRKMIMTR